MRGGAITLPTRGMDDGETEARHTLRVVHCLRHPPAVDSLIKIWPSLLLGCPWTGKSRWGPGVRREPYTDVLGSQRHSGDPSLMSVSRSQGKVDFTFRSFGETLRNQLHLTTDPVVTRPLPGGPTLTGRRPRYPFPPTLYFFTPPHPRCPTTPSPRGRSPPEGRDSPCSVRVSGVGSRLGVSPTPEATGD